MKYICVCFIFIGTLMGAGFVSGRECVVFFADTGFWGALTAGVVSALGALAFMSLGSNAENNLLPGRAYVIKSVITLQTALFLTASFALGEALGQNLFGATGGGIITAPASLVLSKSPEKVFKYVTAATVPFAAALAIAVSVKNGWKTDMGSVTFSVLPAGYAAMNVLIPAMTVSRYADRFSFWGKCFTALLIALFTTLVICLFLLAVRGAEDKMLPAVENASAAGLKIPMVAALALGSVTSAAAALKTGCKKSGMRPFVTTAAALTVSSLGLKFIVGCLYPVMSLIALALLILAVVRAVINFKSPCKKECDLI